MMTKILLIILVIGFVYDGFVIGQMKSKIKEFESLFECRRDLHRINASKIKNIYSNLSKYSEEIEQLKKDLSVLEGIQSKTDIELSKINILDSRIRSLEWHISNLNALLPVRYEPTVTDKPYDPLNPSGIMYDTNTTELK